jgi:hypothetical protein
MHVHVSKQLDYQLYYFSVNWFNQITFLLISYTEEMEASA